MTHKHTLKNMRKLWLPKFMDRRPYTEWEEKGNGARDWAREKIKKILATHKPEPLDPKLEAELQRIIQDKVNDCGSHHFGRQEHSLMANGAPGGNDDRPIVPKEPRIRGTKPKEE